MSSLKERMAAVKEKYYNEGSTHSTIVQHTLAIPNSFSLDSATESPLPPGWEARTSRSKGRTYYCNPSLKLTQWDRPTSESLLVKKAKEANKRNTE